MSRWSVAWSGRPRSSTRFSRAPAHILTGTARIPSASRTPGTCPIPHGAVVHRAREDDRGVLTLHHVELVRDERAERVVPEATHDQDGHGRCDAERRRRRAHGPAEHVANHEAKRRGHPTQKARAVEPSGAKRGGRRRLHRLGRSEADHATHRRQRPESAGADADHDPEGDDRRIGGKLERREAKELDVGSASWPCRARCPTPRRPARRTWR